VLVTLFDESLFTQGRKPCKVTREDVMNRKEIIKMAIESPLYFTMPVKKRLYYINQWEKCFSNNDLREALLSWVRTGHFSDPGSASRPFGKDSCKLIIPRKKKTDRCDWENDRD
jgi:hypothetical protein